MSSSIIADGTVATEDSKIKVTGLKTDGHILDFIDANKN